MSDVVLDHDALVDRLVMLLDPQSQRAEAVRRNFERLEQGALETMLKRLERASARVEAAGAPSRATDDQRRLAFREQEAALQRLDVVSDRICKRREGRDRRDALRAEAGAEANALVRQIAGSGSGKTWTPWLRLRSLLSEDLGDDTLSAFEQVINERVTSTLDAIQVRPPASSAPEAIRGDHSSLDAYMRWIADKAGWDALRLMHGHLPKHVARSKRIRDFYRYNLELRTAAFDPIFIADQKPVLTPTKVADALAKLYCVASDFQPSHVIALGDGGRDISRYLGSELKLTTARQHFFPIFHTNELRQLATGFSGTDRIIIVTGIASEADHLAQARAALMDQMPNMHIAVLAMGSRIDVQQSLETEGLTYFPHLSAERDFDLPWDLGGGYKRDRTNHIFGLDTPFRIARAFMTAATNSLLSIVGAVR